MGFGYTQRNSRQAGFSLVELMVVVAVIGLLSAVAIPNYEKFKVRALQSQAKTQMAAIFGAEHAFATEWGGFSASSKAIGYGPVGKMYYNVGFWSTFNYCPRTYLTAHSVPIPAPTGRCSDIAADYAAESTVNLCGEPGAPPMAGYNCESVLINPIFGNWMPPLSMFIHELDNSTFTIGARGWVSSRNPAMGGTADHWQMDHNKKITQAVNGNY